MTKKTRNVDAERIKDLEDQVKSLQTALSGFMEFVGYKGKPYQSVVENINIKTVNINISK